MNYKVGMFYKLNHLKFKVLAIDGKTVKIRFIGNMTPDFDYDFPIGDSLFQNVEPVPVGTRIIEGYYKRYLKGGDAIC